MLCRASVARSILHGFFAAAVVAAAGCATSPEGDPGAEASGAQIAVLPAAIATIEGEPAAGRAIARIGPTRYALVGDRVGELRAGQRYKLTLQATQLERRDTLEVRRLVELSRVTRLVGTLADDVNDNGAMQLRSVHAKSYTLYGDTTATYKEIRAALPKHDYTKTLFAVNVVQDRGVGARWEWLEYTPVPRFVCTQANTPGTRLELVDVQPDATLLDGFVTTPISGREAVIGPHATCASQGPAYACELDAVGTPWGSARFVPADGRFDLVVTRTDEAQAKVMFSCEKLTRDATAAHSED